jgi:ribonuclease Z
MSTFEVNILGCGSATPTLRHQPTSQVINHRDRLFMVDCGEGAQLQMRRQRLKFSRLNHVFISHVHGDHCLGLPGLLSTLALHEKGSAITLHIVENGIDFFKRAVDFFCGDTPYQIHFEAIPRDYRGIIYEDDLLTVEGFPLYHRVPCCGFIFREKPKLRHIRPDMTEFYNVPVRELAAIRGGADFVTPDGVVVPNGRLTTDAEPAMSYAYCSDTVFDERVAKSVEGVDVLYHEATYDDAYAHNARPRGHSTAREAGRIAHMAGVKRLILGHFSKRYLNEDTLLREAMEEFPNVIAANEGMKIELL